MALGKTRISATATTNPVHESHSFIIDKFYSLIVDIKVFFLRIEKSSKQP
jgi:hypothetical protein